MKFPSSHIFRAYDIRGNATGPLCDFDTDVARLIGYAFSRYLQETNEKQTVVVGHDTRATSYALCDAFITGVLDGGCDVLFLGMCPTPVTYWQSLQPPHPLPRAMITGSHLEAEKNGIKLSIGGNPIFGDQIQDLYQRITPDYIPNHRRGTCNHQPATLAYLDDIAKRVNLMRPIKVVLECFNGATSAVAPQLIQMIGCEVVACLDCQPDGAFSHTQPNPQHIANMQNLREAVVIYGAEMGIAFDGDGDRLGVVDNTGAIIDADRLLVILAEDILTRLPGSTIVADISASKVVLDSVKANNGKLVYSRNGHPFIKATMNKTGAQLGGEVSGHIFLQDGYYGFDDGLFTAIRLIEIVSRQYPRTLYNLDQSMPRLYNTPIYRPYCPPELFVPIIQAVKNSCQSQAVSISELDGLRLDFANGWGLIRQSNTEPVLSMRFEGTTQMDALSYRNLFFDVVAQFPQIDLSAYQD